jgi:raffinose/stachyose/melibiose transport system substrate-binding protein
MQTKLPKLFAFGLALVIAIAGCDQSAAVPKTAATPAVAASAAAKKEALTSTALSLRHTLIKDTSKKRLRMLQDAVSAAEQAIPGLEIVLEGADDNMNRDTKLKADMTAGRAPSMFDMYGGAGDAFIYAAKNQLLDLTPMLDELGIRSQFTNLQQFTYDHKVIGLPVTGTVEGVFYNKQIFAGLGVQPPKTYEALLAICEKAKAKGITPIALASSDPWVPVMMLNTMIVRTAGAAVQEGLIGGTAKWTDHEVVDAFKAYEELIKLGYLQTGNLGLKYPEQQKKFMAGEAAMLFDGSWISKSLTDPLKSQVSNDVGFFSFPELGDKGDSSIQGSFDKGYGFSAKLTLQQKEGVRQFIKQMFNQSMQNRQYTEEGLLPAMLFADNNGVNPLISDIGAATQGAGTTFPSLDAVIQRSVEDALDNGLQLLLGGKTTAVKLTESLQVIQALANAEGNS